MLSPLKTRAFLLTTLSENLIKCCQPKTIAFLFFWRNLVMLFCLVWRPNKRRNLNQKPQQVEGETPSSCYAETIDIKFDTIFSFILHPSRVSLSWHPFKQFFSKLIFKVYFQKKKNTFRPTDETCSYKGNGAEETN